MENRKRKLFIELDFSKKYGNSGIDNSETALRDAISKITSIITSISASNSSVEIKFDIWTNPED